MIVDDELRRLRYIIYTLEQQLETVSGSSNITINVSGSNTITGSTFVLTGANGIAFSTPNSGTLVISGSSGGSLTVNAQTGSITANPINIIAEGCCIHTETSGSDTLIISSSAPCEFTNGDGNIDITIPQNTVISGSQPNTVLLAHLNTNLVFGAFVSPDTGQAGTEHPYPLLSWNGAGAAGLDTTTFKFASGSVSTNGFSNGFVTCNLSAVTSSLGGGYLDNANGTSGDFTYECWIYPTVTTAYGFQNIMGIGSTGGGTGFGLYMYLGGLAWMDPANQAGVATTGFFPTPNIWYAVAICRSGNTTRVYVDGALVYTTVGANLGANLNVAIIGQSPYGAYVHPFQGNIDEVRFSNVAHYTGSSYTPASVAFSDFSGVPVTTTDYCERSFNLDNNIVVTGSVTAPTISGSVGRFSQVTSSAYTGSNAAITNITASSYTGSLARINTITASAISAPIGGDVSGTIANATVIKWQGNAVAPAPSISNGQVYTWNSTESRFATYQGGLDSTVIVQLPMSGTNGSTSFPNLAPVAYAMTAGGGAAISTGSEKWTGSGSAYFDGNDWVYNNTLNSDLQFGNGDWTTEFWVNPNSGYGTGGFSIYAGGLVDFRNGGSSAGYLLMVTTAGKIAVWYAGGPQVAISTTSVPTGSWTYVVAQKYNGNVSIYINGTRETNVSHNYSQTEGYFTVGSVFDRNGLLAYSGYMSDVRVSDIARYGSATTISTPTAPFSAATTATSNIGGDISGTLNAITVTGIQGYPITSSAPSDGDLLVYTGSIWTHLPPTSLPAKPYGAFCDLTTQTASATTVAYPMLFGTTEEAIGVSIVSGSRITFPAAATYNIQFSAQLVKSNAAAADVDIWLSETGSNVPRSNTNVHIVGNNAANVAAWNWVRTFPSGSYAEILWRTSDTNVELLYETSASSPNRPEIPSTILTVTQV